MPKRSGSSIPFPKIVGPNDGELEMATASLAEEVDEHFIYLVRKQQRIRHLLRPLMRREAKRKKKKKKKERKPTVKLESGEAQPMSEDEREEAGPPPLPEEVLQLLGKCENLARLSETRMRGLNQAIKTRNDRMLERMELGKIAIIREIVQTRRTNINWYGPHVIVTPLDETIAERQNSLLDNSVDLLELEKALDQPMDI